MFIAAMKGIDPRRGSRSFQAGGGGIQSYECEAFCEVVKDHLGPYSWAVGRQVSPWQASNTGSKIAGKRYKPTEISGSVHGLDARIQNPLICRWDTP